MSKSVMRKLCPNFDNEDGLETVLEVPIPEEMFNRMGNSGSLRWQTMRDWLNAKSAEKSLSRVSAAAGSNNEFMWLLKLVGSPLIPVQVILDHSISRPVKDSSIEASTAKYIVQQYIAATGGQAVLNGVESMYAMGQVQVSTSDVRQEGQSMSAKRSEFGGFVLWQKNPDLWFLELVVSGNKMSAGSDGKVTWSQSSSQPSHASKGPPRPLRRFFQGLDPRSTANLFLDAVCIGEKTMNKEDCFLLKLDTGADVLKSQSTEKTEIVHHTVWGYFSQRTGLLIEFTDTKLVKMRTGKGTGSVFWETTLESVLEDYRYVDGINIAHSGRTTASLYRYGNGFNHRAKMEESWGIEEVDFNFNGLSMDCFLPPADLKKDQDAKQGDG
ncbi:Protein of unknown function DUF620 [Dillenia turbinata]|uniref:DUF620 domain-containing protein n=1 Tax=Dillenia turbinata TaxID=194707 RepID=A0AAN8ZLQ5_9MAGN